MPDGPHIGVDWSGHNHPKNVRLLVVLVDHARGSVKPDLQIAVRDASVLGTPACLTAKAPALYFDVQNFVDGQVALQAGLCPALAILEIGVDQARFIQGAEVDAIAQRRQRGVVDLTFTG